MKNIYCTLLCLFLANALLPGQDISSTFQSLTEMLKTVNTEKDTYEQSLEQDKENPCKLNITIEVTDHKGRTESERFELYWSDLEENAVRYEVKRDLIYVQFSAENKQSLIKHFEDGEFEGYETDGYIIAADSENAKNLIELIKQGVEICNEMPNQDAPPEEYGQTLIWLNEKIEELSVDDETYAQKIEIDEAYPNRLVYSRNTTDDKGKSTEYVYNFNPADLNPRKVEFDIHRDQIEIKLNAVNGMKMIQSFEDGEFEGFEDEFAFILTDVEVARNVNTALEYIIESGKERMENSLPDVSSLAQVGKVISENVTNIELEEESIQQSLSLDKNCWVSYRKDVVEDETESNQYYFNLSFINSNELGFDISGRKEIIVELTMEEKSLIQHIQNDELQNYENEVELRFDHIENARITIHALKSGIPMCQEKEFPTYDLDWLIENTSEITIDEETFTQSLITEEGKSCNMEYTIKGPDDEYIYEFLLEDLNAKDVKVDVSRTELFIVLSTNRSEKLIKTFENGAPGDYENEVMIRVKDPEIALIAKNTWERVIKNCQ